jgi:hypothetical protein
MQSFWNDTSVRRNDLYQGTASAVPRAVNCQLGFSPCRLFAGAKALSLAARVAARLKEAAEKVEKQVPRLLARSGLGARDDTFKGVEMAQLKLAPSNRPENGSSAACKSPALIQTGASHQIRPELRPAGGTGHRNQ